MLRTQVANGDRLFHMKSRLNVRVEGIATPESQEGDTLRRFATRGP